MRYALVVLLLVLQACSTAPESDERGVRADRTGYWQLVETPLLRIEVVETPNVEFWCKGSFRDATRVRACASRYYSSQPEHNVCTIYIRPLWSKSKSIIDHEKCHCLGYNHDETHSDVWCPVPVETLPYTFTKAPY